MNSGEILFPCSKQQLKSAFLQISRNLTLQKKMSNGKSENKNHYKFCQPQIQIVPLSKAFPGFEKLDFLHLSYGKLYRSIM